MGLLVGSINQQFLIAKRNELEYKISLIKMARLQLLNSSEDLLNAGTDLDPDNPALKELSQRKARLNLLEKKLDMQLNEYKVQLEMVNQGLGLANKMVQSAIKR